VLREELVELAELQALNRKPMYMADWIAKLDDFLQLSDRQILRHAGPHLPRGGGGESGARVRSFGARTGLPAPVEKYFEAAVHDVKQLEVARRASETEEAICEHAQKPR
jgi:hypothetical protein